MNKVIYILIFLSFTKVQAQDDKKVELSAWAVINLEIQDSRRIPFNNINIKINSFAQDIEVKVQSTPKSKLEKWQYSKIDTLFTINKIQFNKVFKSIQKIDLSDIHNTFYVSHKDGYSSSLSFGGYDNKITYKVRSPSNKGDKGYIPNYKETCVLILKLAGFSQEEIDLIL